MQPLLQLAIGLLAIGFCAVSHLYLLRRLQRLTRGSKLTALRLIVIFYGITLSQLIAAVWFTLAFLASVELGLGMFSGSVSPSFVEIFYFSLVNLTTLGLGQLTVTGHLSFLVGLEALTGFLLVSCSASVIISIMHKKTADK